MVIDIVTASEVLGGLVTAVGGIYTGFKRLTANSKRKKEEYRKSILKEATEGVELVKMALESKIDKIESDLQAQKDSVAKDLGFLKETYSSEISNLGNKIEDLREQLNSQHSQLIQLLTKLVDR
jgi:uncharacterized protein Veg